MSIVTSEHYSSSGGAACLRFIGNGITVPTLQHDPNRLADGEITPMRLRGKLVRFYLPDVLQELREKAKTSKRNVARGCDHAAPGLSRLAGRLIFPSSVRSAISIVTAPSEHYSSSGGAASLRFIDNGITVPTLQHDPNRLADGEITPMRLRGKLVRFYLPDVLQELREKAKTSKRNVARRV